MTLTIPTGAKLEDFEINPTRIGVDMGMNLGGLPDYVASPDAFWTATLVYVVPEGDAERRWRGFITALRGHEGTFTLTFPGTYGAFPTGGTMTAISGATTYTTISGGTTYTLVSTPRISAPAARYASRITIEHPGVADQWTPGMVFNVRGYCYQVATIESVSGTQSVTLTVDPPLRTALAGFEQVKAASLTMRLSDPGSGRGLTQAGVTRYELQAVEAY